MAEKQNTPEIRFKGFTDPWEQRKLNQFIYVTSEKNVDGAFVRGDVLSVSREEGVVNQIEFQGRSFAGADVSVYGILRHGDIVYTKSPLRANPYGIIKTNKGRSGIVSTLYATYRARPGVDSDFIQCYFDQDARLNNYLHPLVNKGAKNDMKVSAENAITGNVCFPGCEEQRLISSLFDRLDNLITLHQRKHDKLCTVKRSMLDKMFPKPGETEPEIRFKGFTDPWEQRKLGEVADRYDNLRIPITASERVPGSTPYYGANGIQDYVEGFTHQGEFVLIAEDGASDLDNYPTMCINGIIWVNNHAHVIQGRKDITDNHFIAWSIKRCDIKPMLTGGTRAKLNAEVLMGMRISTPNHAEQISIGSFFEHLDSLITLHQRKLDLLKNTKKSLLDKMFV